MNHNRPMLESREAGFSGGVEKGHEE